VPSTMKSSWRPIVCAFLLRFSILAVSSTSNCQAFVAPSSKGTCERRTTTSVYANICNNVQRDRKEATWWRQSTFPTRKPSAKNILPTASGIVSPTKQLVIKKNSRPPLLAALFSFLVIVLGTNSPAGAATIAVQPVTGSLLSSLDNFFVSMPYTSAFITCGIKSCFADFIAQFKGKGEGKLILNFQRNIAYVLYGGIYLGCGLRFIYGTIFPALFGKAVISTVLFDNFILSPLLTFPLAYVAKAITYGNTVASGVRRYAEDVRERGLLTKAWCLWIPVQSLTFSVVPDHLRIVFVASVSFFWLILLSTLESAGDDSQEECLLTDGFTCDL